MNQRFHVADPALEGTELAGTFGPCDNPRCADPHEDAAECEQLAALEPEGKAYGHARHRDHQLIDVKGQARRYALVCDHLAVMVDQHQFEPADFDVRAHLRAGVQICDCQLEEWELGDWDREARRLNAAGKEQKDRSRAAVGTGNG